MNLKKMMMTFIKLAESRKTFTKLIDRLMNFGLITIQRLIIVVPDYQLI